MHCQHAAELIFRTCITAVSVILLKGPFHLWNICFWLPQERVSEGCPVRGIGNKCLLVIGHPTHLSSNIHAGDLGEFRGCRDIGYSPISLALEQVVNVSAVSRLQKNSTIQDASGKHGLLHWGIMLYISISNCCSVPCAQVERMCDLLDSKGYFWSIILHGLLIYWFEW